MKAGQTDRQPMFQSLIASKPRRAKGNYGATAAAIVIHAAILGALIYLPVRAVAALATDDAVLIALPEDDPIPPAPDLDVPRPAPVQASPAPAGFTSLAIPDIVPTDIPAPQVGVQIRAEDFEPTGIAGGGRGDSTARGSGNELHDAPFITPMDVAPKLLNRDAVSRAVVRYYPSIMRDAGVSGTTKVWFYIDQNGRSIKQLVKTTSGYAALDSAALRVAPEMRFTPAMTRDKPVPVWVAIDIVFQVR